MEQEDYDSPKEHLEQKELINQQEKSVICCPNISPIDLSAETNRDFTLGIKMPLKKESSNTESQAVSLEVPKSIHSCATSFVKQYLECLRNILQHESELCFLRKKYFSGSQNEALLFKECSDISNRWAGYITLEEFKSSLKRMGIKISTRSTIKFFMTLDTQKKCRISISKFISIFIPENSDSKSPPQDCKEGISLILSKYSSLFEDLVNFVKSHKLSESHFEELLSYLSPANLTLETIKSCFKVSEEPFNIFTRRVMRGQSESKVGYSLFVALVN